MNEYVPLSILVVLLIMLGPPVLKVVREGGHGIYVMLLAAVASLCTTLMFSINTL